MNETAAPVPGRKKLVVVEDDRETRELELFLLGSEDYQVLGLEDGETAAETVRRECADLVILDLMLPKKDGTQVLAELANEPTTANTPVIIVSAYVDRPATREALSESQQVKRIFEKPFDITELLGAVAHELAATRH
jgi:two-component system sensor histidine kinase/response regulator